MLVLSVSFLFSLFFSASYSSSSPFTYTTLPHDTPLLLLLHLSHAIQHWRLSLTVSPSHSCQAERVTDEPFSERCVVRLVHWFMTLLRSPLGLVHDGSEHWFTPRSPLRTCSSLGSRCTGNVLCILLRSICFWFSCFLSFHIFPFSLRVVFFFLWFSVIFRQYHVRVPGTGELGSDC